MPRPERATRTDLIGPSPPCRGTTKVAPMAPSTATASSRAAAQTRGQSHNDVGSTNYMPSQRGLHGDGSSMSWAGGGSLNTGEPHERRAAPADQVAIDRMVADGREIGMQVAVAYRGHLIVDAVAGTCNGLLDTGQAARCSTRRRLRRGGGSCGARPGRAGRARRRPAHRRRVARTGRPRQAGHDPAPRAEAHRRCAGTSLRHHRRGLVRLGPHVRRAGRRHPVVAARHPVRLSRPDLRLPAGRDHAPCHRAPALRVVTWHPVTGPLGVEDEVHFGVPERLLGRVAHQHASSEPLPEPPAGSPADQALPPGIRPSAAFANRHDVLTAEIVSLGTMTAAAPPASTPPCSVRSTGWSWCRRPAGR